MFSIPLPYPQDARLLFSPPWHSLPLPGQIAVLAAVCLVPLALLLWLYRYELKLISPVSALGLLALRLTVLALLLALMCLQPMYVRDSVHGVPGRVIVAIDRSASMELRDPTRSDALTRTEAARRLLGPEGANLLGKLRASGHEPLLVGFHRETWQVDANQPNDLFKPVESGQFTTDLRGPLEWAVQRSGPTQPAVLGVVLLTDGQHNGSELPGPKAEELGQNKVPLYAVALGARTPPPDVAVTRVVAPQSAFFDVDATIDVQFKVTGLPAQDIVVELVPEGGEKQERTVPHTPRPDRPDQEYTERFTVRMDRAGARAYQVNVRPKSKDTKETTADNNSRTATINVAKDKAKTLVIDGEARWEYHYLASALARDRSMDLDRVVFQQPRLNNTLSPEDLKKLGHPDAKLPAREDAFAKYDCIILGDVTAEQLPLADRVRLEKYVADRGGTLVLLAGKRAMPLGFPEAAPGGEVDPLRKLLPLEEPKPASVPEGFRTTLTEQGRTTDFLKLKSEPEDRDWDDLPLHFWAVTGQLKPGATALAVIPAGAGGADKERPLIVRQSYGFGRVLYVGLDSTWRWRYKEGDMYHHRFWGQAIRWAASEKPLPTNNDFVQFGTPQPVYREGQDVEIVVRLNEELGPIKADLLAGARILRPGKDGKPDEPVALVPLTRREAQPRVLDGKVRDLPSGDYAIELVIPDLGADKLAPRPGEGKAGESLRAPFRVTHPDSEELLRLETNFKELEDLAGKGGGRVFTEEDAAELVDLLAKKMVPVPEHEEQKLWEWWVFLVIVSVLLAGEWAWRKAVGLP